MLECGRGAVKVGVGAQCVSKYVYEMGKGMKGGKGRLSMVLSHPGGAE